MKRIFYIIVIMKNEIGLYKIWNLYNIIGSLSIFIDYICNNNKYYPRT